MNSLVKQYRRLLHRDHYNGNQYDALFCIGCHEVILHDDTNQKAGDACVECGDESGLVEVTIVGTKEIRDLEYRTEEIT